ncbi:MAG: phage baseplate assembly protein V [Pirellulales bacterium]|nr:phage baseplate assembly protein V [Pirellulales bacterium]
MNVADAIEDLLTPRNRYYGKYKGVVVNQSDPKGMGRIQVLVPDVSATAISSWALPCLPWAGRQFGFFTVPLPGSSVWIEFEQGDPDYPIWVGCFWETSAEMPSCARSTPAQIPSLTVQTPLQHSIQISDLPGPTGGIQLRTPLGAKIVVTNELIEISNGTNASIKLVGPTVSINGTALTVT